jgi:hypothetical protein
LGQLLLPQLLLLHALLPQRQQRQHISVCRNWGGELQGQQQQSQQQTSR